MVKTKKEESTSTAVAVVTPEEQAYLDSLNPAATQTEYSGPRRLVINTAAKDADGNRRPIGGWHIQGTDQYYDGVIRFRPIRHMNKLIRYHVESNGAYKMAGESIYFHDFSEEIIDSLGTVALGRKFGRSYSDEQKEATRKMAECYLDIFGLVSFGDSEETHPVMYRVRGSKIMKMLNAFRSVPKDKRFSEYEYKLESFQPDGKQYWDIEVTPDMSKRLPISPILAFDKEIQTFIAETNLQVINSYKKNHLGNVAATLVAANVVPSTATLVDEDELPF